MASDEYQGVIFELLELLDSEASFTDIHIEQDAPVSIRTPAGWMKTDMVGIPCRDDIEIVLNKIDSNWQGTIASKAINRPLDLAKWRLRVNGYLANGGEKLMMTIRRLPASEPNFKDTGLPNSARLMIEIPSGLMLITGATGSGKSTTQAALIDCINESRSAHIITIEDPIEYKFRRKKSIFSQREVGVDCASFSEGAIDAMRQRPDVIVIGEIRDKDTAETALLAAESGHLVIGTMHANTAPGAVQKALSWFAAHERDARQQTLASTLIGVISQVLVPRKDLKGYALASELMFNHKQQISKFIGKAEQMVSALERKEDGVSQTMVESMEALVKNGIVEKGAALRSLKDGQAALFDRLKGVA